MSTKNLSINFLRLYFSKCWVVQIRPFLTIWNCTISIKGQKVFQFFTSSLAHIHSNIRDGFERAKCASEVVSEHLILRNWNVHIFHLILFWSNTVTNFFLVNTVTKFFFWSNTVTKFDTKKFDGRTAELVFPSGES